MPLQTIETGLDLGSRFLTKETAYFLGMLLADEQITYNGIVYWQAAVRHNPRQVTDYQLEEHITLIREIAAPLGKQGSTQPIEYYKASNIPIEKFNAGKRGIVTLFQQTIPVYSINDFIRDIEAPLLASSDEIQQAFLVGVFDGRGSYDKTAKFVVVDYESTETRELLSAVLNNLHIETNINALDTARRRTGGTSAPRKKQLRIRHESFLRNIGFISPARYEKATIDISERYREIVFPDTLSGLKGIEES